MQAEEEPQIEKLSLKHAPKSDHRSDTDTEMQRVEIALRAVQLALEILTAVCATIPDPEPSSNEDVQDELIGS